MLLVQIVIAVFMIAAVSYFVYSFVRDKQMKEMDDTMEDPVVEEKPYIAPEVKKPQPKSAPRKRPNNKKTTGNKPAVKTKK